MPSIKSYVISLTAAHDRREHIKQEFGSRGVDFEFFDALTPSDVDRVDRELGIALSDSPNQSPIEKACFASQVILWQQFLDSGEKYLAVFEDDVRLSGDIAEFLSVEFCESLPDFDILKLETVLKPVRLDKAIAAHKDRQIQRLLSSHFGAGAYLISRQGAKNAIALIQKRQADAITAIDCLLFNHFIGDLRIYQISPAVCIQYVFLKECHLPSQIEAQRQDFNRNRPRHKSNAPRDKIQRLFLRLKRSAAKRLFYKVVNFK